MISIDYSIIIVILNFILLLIILNKLLFKPVKGYLEKRQEEVKSELDRASKGRKEADMLLQQRQQELKESAEEIRTLTRQAKKEAEMQAEKILKQAKEKEKKIVQETQEKIEISQKEAFRDLEDEVIDFVAKLSGKVIDSKLDSAADKKLINSLLKKDS